MRKISIFRYRCGYKGGALNRSCALLRVEATGGVGYADLAPWRTLGDPAVDELLFSSHPLWRQALFFSSFPLSMWKTSPIRSHTLYSTGAAFIDSGLSFSAAKIKCGKDDWVQLLSFLSSHKDLYKGKPLRLDLNSALSYEEFLQERKILNEISSIIDYIEDPFPYAPSLWKQAMEQTQIALAKDHDCHEAYGVVKTLIIKPVLHNMQFIKKAFNKGHRLIFSSYLGHPLECQQSSYIANKIGIQGDFHGLSDPSLYLEYDFETNRSLESLEWEEVIC